MYAATLDKISLLVNLIPQCLRQARDFLIVPDRLHRWCAIVIASVIFILVGFFVAYAYAEKYNLVDNFFYGKLQFSFIDGGYPELFGYALEIVACALFASFAWVHAKKQWYAWATILFVTFLDDAFRSHETIGQSFTVWFGVSPVGGDLIGFAITGILSAVLWCAGIVKVNSEEDLSAYFVFTMYYALMIFFGVGADAIHGLFGDNMSQTVFTLFEDGGELVTAAIICLSALGMWLREKQRTINSLEKYAVSKQDNHGASATRKTF
jgi:TRAP-type C4-dicarboxylate transport system permease small subunit